MPVASNMLSLILYLLVMVNQIECQDLTYRKHHQTTSTSASLQATKYDLTDTIVIEVNPNENRKKLTTSEEYNYIINVSKTSFLRIVSRILDPNENTARVSKNFNLTELKIPNPRTIQQIDNEDILFIMKTNNSVKSWKIKQSTHRTKYDSHHAATISKTAANNEEIRITVHSQHFQHVGFRIDISLLNDTDVMLELGKSINTTISKSTSRLFQYIFPNSTNSDDMVLLKIQETSQTCQCSLVSVQPVGSNQLYDEEENMRYGNGTMYQTMSSLSAIILKKTQFPNGANIILLSVKDKKECFEECFDQPKRMQGKTRKYGELKHVTISIEKMEEDPLISTIAILSAYFGMCLIACVTLCLFKRGIGVAGKVDTYRINLEQQRDENKKTKNQQNSIYAVAAAKAGFNRKMVQADKEIPMEHLDASQQSIQYIDQDEEEAEHYPKIEKETSKESKITTREDTPDSNNAAHKRKTFNKKSRKNLSVSHKMHWQETLETEDELDGPTIIRKTHNSMRLRHPSDRDTLVTHYVQLDQEKLKQKRNDRKSVRVADLTIQHDDTYFSDFVTMRSEMFVWLIFLAGIYYTLPVFQLVFKYQETSLTSGNLDTCYYNYLCQYPYGRIADYGHVFSNIGYIILGISFMGIVRFRSFKNKQLIDKFTENELGLYHPKHTGIPESYGIFYALGASLMFEGILSGCYHVCPTETNFQFDTTFMYCISVLVFLKVYQFRHHDVTSTAHLVFLAIGVALIFEVVGIFTNHIIFWLLFVLFYITFVFVFIIQIHYNWSGDLKSRLASFWNEARGVMSGQCCTAPARNLLSIHPKTMLGSISVLIVNILLAFYFLSQTSQTRGVSRYILTILMANMFLYVSHYISCKLHYRFKVKDWKPTEGIRYVTMLYGALSILSMLAAGYFFQAELKSSKKSPAESRDLNKPCTILIFDNHDIWHFLSAGGLFYLFMFILTLEDYNRDQQRDKIPVF